MMPTKIEDITVNLALCTETLLHEIAHPMSTQKDIAQTYALAMASDNPTDWKVVNQAIIKRWSLSGLRRIKRMAHNGKCWHTEKDWERLAKRRQ